MLRCTQMLNGELAITMNPGEDVLFFHKWLNFGLAAQTCLRNLTSVELGSYPDDRPQPPSIPALSVLAALVMTHRGSWSGYDLDKLGIPRSVLDELLAQLQDYHTEQGALIEQYQSDDGKTYYRVMPNFDEEDWPPTAREKLHDPETGTSFAALWALEQPKRMLHQKLLVNEKYKKMYPGKAVPYQTPEEIEARAAKIREYEEKRAAEKAKPEPESNAAEPESNTGPKMAEKAPEIKPGVSEVPKTTKNAPAPVVVGKPAIPSVMPTATSAGSEQVSPRARGNNDSRDARAVSNESRAHAVDIYNNTESEVGPNVVRSAGKEGTGEKPKPPTVQPATTPVIPAPTTSKPTPSPIIGMPKREFPPFKSAAKPPMPQPPTPRPPLPEKKVESPAAPAPVTAPPAPPKIEPLVVVEPPKTEPPASVAAEPPKPKKAAKPKAPPKPKAEKAPPAPKYTKVDLDKVAEAISTHILQRDIQIGAPRSRMIMSGIKEKGTMGLLGYEQRRQGKPLVDCDVLARRIKEFADDWKKTHIKANGDPLDLPQGADTFLLHWSKWRDEQKGKKKWQDPKPDCNLCGGKGLVYFYEEPAIPAGQKNLIPLPHFKANVFGKIFSRELIPETKWVDNCPCKVVPNED